MGKGKEPHEDVIRYLTKTFGESEETSFESIYNKPPVSMDYIGNTEKCNALVDVIGKVDEEWRTVIGKVVAMCYEIKNNPNRANKEVWIIYAIKDKSWKNWWKNIQKIVKNCLEEEFVSKIKFKVFDSEKRILLDL